MKVRLLLIILILLFSYLSINVVKPNELGLKNQTKILKSGLYFDNIFFKKIIKINLRYNYCPHKTIEVYTKDFFRLKINYTAWCFLQPEYLEKINNLFLFKKTFSSDLQSFVEQNIDLLIKNFFQKQDFLSYLQNKENLAQLKKEIEDFLKIQHLELLEFNYCLDKIPTELNKDFKKEFKLNFLKSNLDNWQDLIKKQGQLDLLKANFKRKINLLLKYY